MVNNMFLNLKCSIRNDNYKYELKYAKLVYVDNNEMKNHYIRMFRLLFENVEPHSCKFEYQVLNGFESYDEAYKIASNCWGDYDKAIKEFDLLESFYNGD